MRIRRCFLIGDETAPLLLYSGCRRGGLDQWAEMRTKNQTEYEYIDESGVARYRVVRVETISAEGAKKKQFWQERTDGNGGWIKNMHGVEIILYRLPEVIGSKKEDRHIFIVEGEKDADTLSNIDLIATTNPGGAGKWSSVTHPERYFKGRKVILVPDNDEIGRKHMLDVANSLSGVAAQIQILYLPGMQEKSDVSDYLANGANRDNLLSLVRETPLWQPEPSEQPGTDDWDVPNLLDGDSYGSDLPLSALPAVVRNHVRSISEFTQTPVNSSFLTALSAIAATVAKKFVVEVRPGFSEPLMLWAVSVLEPSNRKSAVQRQFLSMIRDHEEDLVKEVQVKRARAEDERDILESQLKDQKKDAAKASSPEKQHQLRYAVESIREDLERVSVPSIPQLLADDITAETLALVAANNHGVIAVFSAEGDIFKLMAGRYSTDKSANFEFHKKAWTGKESHRADRITRDSVYVRNPALTMGIMVQPAVLEYLKNLIAFRGEGLLGRFLYDRSKSRIGFRKTGPEAPSLDQDAADRFNNLMLTLLQTRPHNDEDEEWEPHTLTLSEGAEETLWTWEAEVERMLRPDGDLYDLMDWGGKLIGQTIRIAGLLHLAELAGADKDPWDTDILDSTMQNAVQIAQGLIEHAQAVYALMGIDPNVKLALYVWGRIKSYSGQEPLTVRVVHRLCQGKQEIKKVSQVRECLNLLAEHNYLRVGKKVGGKSEPIMISPHFVNN